MNLMALLKVGPGRKFNSAQIYILCSSILACSILYAVEQSIGVSYIIKTGVKLIMFSGIPFFYMKYVKKGGITDVSKQNKLYYKGTKVGFLAGFLFFVVVLGAYFVLQDYIDFGKISEELTTKLRITPINFVFVGLYIILGNSFLEEFFFRGFIFMNFHSSGYGKLGYLYSSVLFGLYHIAIFKTWFSTPITLLALFGLISVGVLFNWMDTKSNNFMNSWISHAFADAAIILIGLRMFRII